VFTAAPLFDASNNGASKADQARYSSSKGQIYHSHLSTPAEARWSRLGLHGCSCKVLYEFPASRSTTPRMDYHVSLTRTPYIVNLILLSTIGAAVNKSAIDFLNWALKWISENLSIKTQFYEVGNQESHTTLLRNLQYMDQTVSNTITFDHRLRKPGHPVRSAIHKPQIG
jgi:hypothetical protein